MIFYHLGLNGKRPPFGGPNLNIMKQKKFSEYLGVYFKLTIGISMFSYFALNYDTSPNPLYYDYVPNEETKNIG